MKIVFYREHFGLSKYIFTYAEFLCGSRDKLILSSVRSKKT